MNIAAFLYIQSHNLTSNWANNVVDWALNINALYVTKYWSDGSWRSFSSQSVTALCMSFQCGIKRIYRVLSIKLSIYIPFFIFLIIQFLLVSRAILVSAHLKNYAFKATFESRSDRRTSIIKKEKTDRKEMLYYAYILYIEMHSDFFFLVFGYIFVWGAVGRQQTAPWDQIQVFIHVLIKGTDWKVA